MQAHFLAQPGLVTAALPHMEILLSGELKFEFTRIASDRAQFARNWIMHKLAEHIHEIGNDFYGGYQVVVCNIIDNIPDGTFNWKRFTSGQHGIGFIVGLIHEGRDRYPARSFSLKPPSTIGIEALCEGLNVPSNLSKVPSEPLKLVQDLTQLPVTPHAEDFNTVLAKALKAVSRQKTRRNEAIARVERLRTELSLVRDELERRPDFELLVQQRLAELLGEDG